MFDFDDIFRDTGETSISGEAIYDSFPDERGARDITDAFDDTFALSRGEMLESMDPDDVTSVFEKLNPRFYEQYQIDRENLTMLFIEHMYGEKSSNIVYSAKDINEYLINMSKESIHGKILVDELLETFMSLPFTENPRTMSVTREMLMPALIGLGKVKAPEKIIPRFKGLFDVSLDTIEADLFISDLSTKELLTKKDLEEVNNMIFKRDAIAVARSKINDFLEELFMDIEEDVNKRYGLAVRYNKLLQSIKENIDNIAMNIGRGRHEDVKGMLTFLKETGYAQKHSIESVERVLAEFNQFLTSTESEIRMISVEVDLLLNDLNEYMLNKSFATFKLDSDIISKMLKLSVEIETIMKGANNLTNKSFGLSGSTEFGGGGVGSVSGGFILSLISNNLFIIDGDLKEFINFVNTIGDFGKDLDPALKKIVSLYSGSKIGGSKSSVVNKKETYYQSESKVSGNTIIHKFFIGKELTDNLRSLGANEGIIREIRSVVSNEIFGRLGLDDQISDFVYAKIMNKLI